MSTKALRAMNLFNNKKLHCIYQHSDTEYMCVPLFIYTPSSESPLSKLYDTRPKVLHRIQH